MKNTFGERDEFQRRGIAEKLISLINSDIDASPMVLDGSWGSGKTEFCHKFINLVVEQKQEFECIYMNTFQYDHSDDPLLMLISGISGHR